MIERTPHAGHPVTVLGDSFVEGRGDPAPGDGFRGWVPRFAGWLSLPRKTRCSTWATTARLHKRSWTGSCARARRQGPADRRHRRGATTWSATTTRRASGATCTPSSARWREPTPPSSPPVTPISRETCPLPDRFRTLMRERFAEANAALYERHPSHRHALPRSRPHAGVAEPGVLVRGRPAPQPRLATSASPTPWPTCSPVRPAWPVRTPPDRGRTRFSWKERHERGVGRPRGWPAPRSPSSACRACSRWHATTANTGRTSSTGSTAPKRCPRRAGPSTTTTTPTRTHRTRRIRGAARFLPDVEFDPLEFGMPPNQLEVTSTVQPLSLVVARDLLRDAGPPESGLVRPVPHRCGAGHHRPAAADAPARRPAVHAGAQGGGAQLRAVRPRTPTEIAEKYVKAFAPWEENSFPGLLANVVAGRIANRLDLGGMNCTVDAACAASLSAIRLAVRRTRRRPRRHDDHRRLDTENTIFTYMCFSKRRRALARTRSAVRRRRGRHAPRRGHRHGRPAPARRRASATATGSTR